MTKRARQNGPLDSAPRTPGKRGFYWTFGLQWSAVNGGIFLRRISGNLTTGYVFVSGSAMKEGGYNGIQDE